MAYSFAFDKNVLARKLKDLGVTDMHLEELFALFDQKSRHIDVVTFISSTERFDITREKLYSFLKAVGIDDPTLITAFFRVDLKKAGLDEDRVQEIVLQD